MTWPLALFMLSDRKSRQYHDDFMLAFDQQFYEAVNLYLEKVKILDELAGATSLAAALLLREHFAGKKSHRSLAVGICRQRNLAGDFDAPGDQPALSHLFLSVRGLTARLLLTYPCPMRTARR